MSEAISTSRSSFRDLVAAGKNGPVGFGLMPRNPSLAVVAEGRHGCLGSVKEGWNLPVNLAGERCSWGSSWSAKKARRGGQKDAILKG